MDDIGDYMSSPILSVDSESSVLEAANYMNANGVGCVLISELGDFVGMVTETDLTRKVLGKGLNAETTTVSSIMSSPLLSMDRYLPVEEANRFMHKNRIRHLVVTEEDKIVGMLSVKDLVSYFAKDFRMQE
ncbi:MAG: CBS domain-containing protein [Nitrospinae bacterium]|nr:CBS domain-containing protein [Nitrospinota bacterium]